MNEVKGLEFRLSEGTEGAETRSVTPPAKTDPLSRGDADSLLKRIPPVKTESDDQKDFAVRERSLPAPKTGKVNPVKFPAPEDLAAPNANIPAKLDVLRFSPTGEVSIAPEMTVTFSQPMVAITSQEQAAETVPVRLTPEVKGKWRWLGTKTLMFDAEQRFPQGDKIYRHDSRRDQVRRWRHAGKRCFVVIYHTAAGGENHASGEPDNAPRCADVPGI